MLEADQVLAQLAPIGVSFFGELCIVDKLDGDGALQPMAAARSKHTGQPLERVEKTLDRDYFLSAEDARTFGIVDEVITKRHPLDETIQKLMPLS